MNFKIDSEFEKLIFPLRKSEFEELKKSLMKEGCRDPLIVWREKNVLLDGHNRNRICKENDIDFEIKEISIVDREQAKIWIMENLLIRRNLNFYQKIVVVLRLWDYEKKEAEERKLSKLKQFKDTEAVKLPPRSEDWGDTRDKIGARVGASGRTVDKVRKIENRATNEERKQLIADELSIDKLYKMIKRKEKGERIRKEREIKIAQFDKLPSGVLAIELGRFQDVTKKFPDNYVDAIVTDPPYAEEYLDDWFDLARISKRILKPSGFLITYAGTVHLDKVMRLLNRYLLYYWQIILDCRHEHYIVHGRNIFHAYKPILVYQKRPFKRIENWIYDVIEGTGPEKDLHKWQQSGFELEKLVKGFTEANDLILDPFAGSGTTASVCLGLKRRIILIDDKEENIKKIKERLSGTGKNI